MNQRRKHQVRLQFEILEDRCVMSGAGVLLASNASDLSVGEHRSRDDKAALVVPDQQSEGEQSATVQELHSQASESSSANPTRSKQSDVSGAPTAVLAEPEDSATNATRVEDPPQSSDTQTETAASSSTEANSEESSHSPSPGEKSDGPEAGTTMTSTSSSSSEQDQTSDTERPDDNVSEQPRPDAEVAVMVVGSSTGTSKGSDDQAALPEHEHNSDASVHASATGTASSGQLAEIATAPAGEVIRQMAHPSRSGAEIAPEPTEPVTSSPASVPLAKPTGEAHGAVETGVPTPHEAQPNLVAASRGAAEASQPTEPPVPGDDEAATLPAVTFVSQHAGLLTALLPVQATDLQLGMERFLNQLDRLGDSLTATPEIGSAAWLLATVATLTALEMTRRHRKLRLVGQSVSAVSTVWMSSVFDETTDDLSPTHP